MTAKTTVLALGVGFAGGWVVRSLADSPRAVGVKLLAIALTAKESVDRWAAVERDRLEDMLAEARSSLEPTTLEPGAPKANGTTSPSGLGARTTNEEP
jgi:hypothetical protein